MLFSIVKEPVLRNSAKQSCKTQLLVSNAAKEFAPPQNSQNFVPVCGSAHMQLLKHLSLIHIQMCIRDSYRVIQWKNIYDKSFLFFLVVANQCGQNTTTFGLTVFLLLCCRALYEREDFVFALTNSYPFVNRLVSNLDLQSVSSTSEVMSSYALIQLLTQTFHQQYQTLNKLSSPSRIVLNLGRRALFQRITSSSYSFK